MRYFGFGVLALALAGCSQASLVEQSMPDREVFRFETSDGSEVNAYACKTSATQAETLERAKRAHLYFERQLDRMADREAALVVDSLDGKADPDFEAMALRIESAAVKTLNETERRYQCLFFDSYDT